MSNSQQEDRNWGEILPSYYGEDCLVALPRDPYYLFSYWEISIPTRQRLQREWGEKRWQSSTLQLRICKHSWEREKEVESFLDIPLSPEADSWYQQVSDSDRIYHAEIGWQLPEGDFQPVILSNPVKMARDGLSDIIDEEWQLPDWKARKLFRRISLYHLSSPELFRRRKQRT